MGRYGKIDYSTYTRRGFGLGVTLLVIGILGEVALPLVAGPLPGWERTLFFDLEVIGVLLALFVPIIFGIVMPLTE